MNFFRYFTIVALVCSGVGFRADAQQSSSGGGGNYASTTKIFLTTATYGVMAGSLVGLASMAFYKNPGSNLRNVAIGASLGLYTGIMLGAYVRYIVPDRRASRSAAPGSGQPAPPQAPGAPPGGNDDEGAPLLDPDDPLGIGRGASLEDVPRAAEIQLALYPVYFYEKEAAGLALDYRF